MIKMLKVIAVERKVFGFFNFKRVAKKFVGENLVCFQKTSSKYIVFIGKNVVKFNDIFSVNCFFKNFKSLSLSK